MLRAELAKTFAMSSRPLDSSEGFELFRLALDDVDPVVRQFAIMGFASWKLDEGRSLLRSALREQSPIVRMAAAGALLRFDGEVELTVKALEAALAVESDTITEKTMAGSLQELRRRRHP